ncbi:hypothetical protein [Bacillus smithii]|uniref:hypothetical protein n=1 Tax=Bacillus smithii TaxID=1479 RepID=UPI00077BFBCE|nr:hypothetical protein [Bacillus smithii]
MKSTQLRTDNDELLAIICKYQFALMEGLPSVIIDLDDLIFLIDKAIKAKYLQQEFDRNRFKKS